MLQFPTVRPGAGTARRPIGQGQAQAEAAAEALWKAYWPYISATVIGVFMLMFGLAVAGIEAANLEVGGNVAVTTVTISTSSSQASALRIGVGIWSGAIVAVAAISIFVINCSSKVMHSAKVAMSLVSAAAIFSVVNFSINAKMVRLGVVTGGFNSSDPTAYRLAAAQIPAASLSFIACLAFILMYSIVVGIQIRRITKRKEPIGFPR